MRACLTIVRDRHADVSVSVYDRLPSDRAWTSQWGHLVVRAELRGHRHYWIRDLDGRWSRQETLADARDTCVWLKERGR